MRCCQAPPNDGWSAAGALVLLWPSSLGWLFLAVFLLATESTDQLTKDFPRNSGQKSSQTVFPLESQVVMDFGTKLAFVPMTT